MFCSNYFKTWIHDVENASTCLAWECWWTQWVIPHFYYVTCFLHTVGRTAYSTANPIRTKCLVDNKTSFYGQFILLWSRVLRSYMKPDSIAHQNELQWKIRYRKFRITYPPCSFFASIEYLPPLTTSTYTHSLQKCLAMRKPSFPATCPCLICSFQDFDSAPGLRGLINNWVYNFSQQNW